jgi:hypothetical protein
MTIINDELSLQIQTLRDAGLGYKKILFCGRFLLKKAKIKDHRL